MDAFLFHVDLAFILEDLLKILNIILEAFADSKHPVRTPYFQKESVSMPIMMMLLSSAFIPNES